MPVNVTGASLSNWPANEWCADAGSIANAPIKKIADFIRPPARHAAVKISFTSVIIRTKKSSGVGITGALKCLKRGPVSDETDPPDSPVERVPELDPVFAQTAIEPLALVGRRFLRGQIIHKKRDRRILIRQAPVIADVRDPLTIVPLEVLLLLCREILPKSIETVAIIQIQPHAVPVVDIPQYREVSLPAWHRRDTVEATAQVRRGAEVVNTNRIRRIVEVVLRRDRHARRKAEARIAWIKIHRRTQINKLCIEVAGIEDLSHDAAKIVSGDWRVRIKWNNAAAVIY